MRKRISHPSSSSSSSHEARFSQSGSHHVRREPSSHGESTSRHTSHARSSSEQMYEEVTPHLPPVSPPSGSSMTHELVKSSRASSNKEFVKLLQRIQRDLLDLKDPTGRPRLQFVSRIPLGRLKSEEDRRHYRQMLMQAQRKLAAAPPYMLSFALFSYHDTKGDHALAHREGMLCYRSADFFTICGQAIISVDGSPSYPRLIAQYAGHGIMLLLSFFPENQHKDFTKELHRLQKGPNTKESSVLSDQQSQKSTKGKEHMQSQQRGAEQTSESECLSIIILGAYERFSKQKLFPALFKLYVQGFFKNIKVRFFGYSNERLKDEEYLRGLRRCLERGKAVSSQEIVVELFLRSVSYIPGRYDDESSFRILENKVAAHEDNTNCQRGRLFYFALEPDFYAAVGKLIKENCMSTGGWNRVIIENPFEKDCEACEELGHWFTQEEIYRVDYYLGKEVVQDLLFMRFTNRLFLPIWNRDHIKQIKIVVKEEFGTEGSFNEKSIIRNIIQGHLLQVLCFLAMERPVSLKEDDIRDEKMKILKSIRPIKCDDVLRHQQVGLRSVEIVLQIGNGRWEGVPFKLKVVKSSNNQKEEIRMQFKDVPNDIYEGQKEGQNELIVSLKPSAAAMKLKLTHKKMGKQRALDFSYEEGQEDVDVYARLLLFMIRGDQSHFIREDEVRAARKIFSPLLH